MYSKNRIFLLLCGTSKDFINAFKLLIKVFALSQISAKRIPEKLNFAMLLEGKKVKLFFIISLSSGSQGKTFFQKFEKITGRHLT